MLAPQLPLPPLVVFQLVGELCLVLGPNQLCSCLLDRPQVPELQLLHRLMMPEQHGMLQVLLCLPLVQLLRKRRNGGERSGQINKGNKLTQTKKMLRLSGGGWICVFNYLPGQILLHIVSGNEDPALEPPTLQLQVLPLSPQQVGLFLRLGNNI